MAQVMNIMVYDIVAMATTSQLDADKWSVLQRSTVRVAAMIDLMVCIRSYTSEN